MAPTAKTLIREPSWATCRRLLRSVAAGSLSCALFASVANPAPSEPVRGSAGTPVASTGCLPTGDGYFRARLGGAIDTRIDWPNSGTQCDGETKTDPAGVRLSFKRTAGGAPDLLFLVGVTGVRKAESAHAAGANLTVIVQGTADIFGTRGDSRCTVDSLSQKALATPDTYRIEARGFCTQPAHALRGNGYVLVSTFEFAGMVRYEP